MPITTERILNGFTIEVTRNDHGASLAIPNTPLDPIEVFRNGHGVALVHLPERECRPEHLNATYARALASMLLAASEIAYEMNGGTN